MTTDPHRYYPIFLQIAGRNVLIVGGGEVAARKVETLLRYGARITVVATHIAEFITEMASSGRLMVRSRAYSADDIEDQFLVVAATNDTKVNRQVALDARVRGAMVNVVDLPQLCDFIVPAILQRAPIQVAVSTGGSSPALARIIRQRVEAVITPGLAELTEMLGSLRTVARETLHTDAERKRFFDGVVDSDVLSHLESGRRGDAYRSLRELCHAAGIVLPPDLSSRLEAPDEARGE